MLRHRQTDIVAVAVFVVMFASRAPMTHRHVGKIRLAESSLHHTQEELSVLVQLQVLVPAADCPHVVGSGHEENYARRRTQNSRALADSSPASRQTPVLSANYSVVGLRVGLDRSPKQPAVAAAKDVLAASDRDVAARNDGGQPHSPNRDEFCARIQYSV